MLTPNTLDATFAAGFCCIHGLSDKEVTTAQEEIFLLDKTIKSTIYIIARAIVICKVANGHCSQLPFVCFVLSSF